MNKPLFVIAIAVGAVTLTTLLQVFLRGRELGPKARRMLWVTLGAGVIALAGVCWIIWRR